MSPKKDVSYHILRIALGITFVWIGILIFQNPETWGGYIQPWAADLLPIPLREAMIGTAILDIAVGFLFLIDVLTWAAGIIGALHLIVVLTTAGISGVTVRDIGILGGAIAIAYNAWKYRK